MEVNQEDVRDYVPAWNDNRELPEDEQVILELAPMTGGELRRAQRAAMGRDGKVSLKSAQAAIESIIKKRVIALHNCADILGRPISTSEELWDRAEQALIDECYAALTEISTLSEGMRKK